MDIKDTDRRPLPAMSNDPRSVRARIEALERVMEHLFTVPGINRKVGLDVLLDLVPVVGSTAASLWASTEPPQPQPRRTARARPQMLLKNY